MKKLIGEVVAAASLVILSTRGHAQPSCQTIPTKINVIANQLDKSLIELARQIDCKIEYDKKLIQTFQGNAVKGNLAPWDALTQLIKGTGLEVHSEKNGLDINQADQSVIGIKASKLQASLGQAVKSQKLTQHVANRMYAELSEVRASVVELAKKQGFVSAGEKASYKRTFDKAEHLLASAK